MTTNITLDELLDTLADKVAERLGSIASNGTAPDAAPAKKKAAKAEPEPEDDEDDDTESDEGTSQEDRRAELTAMRITSLRKIAKDLGFPADDVAAADKETLVESIVDDEFGDGDDADDDDADDDGDDADDTDDDESEDEDEEEDDEPDDDEEDDDEDDEGDGDDDYTREDLEGMSLKELKALGKEAGYTAADFKGLDQDAIVDMMLGEDPDVDDEDEDDDEDGYSEEELLAMNLRELKSLAKEWDVKIPTKDAKSKKAIVALLLDE